MTRKVAVWDIAVRLFHWSLVAGFVANDFFVRPGKPTHRMLGYVIAGLIGFRLVWGVIGTRHARFRDFPPSFTGAVEQLRDMANGRRRVHLGHSPLGALMIYNLLLTVLGIVASGYAMTTVTFFGVDWVSQTHSLLVIWAEFSIVLHIAAVLFESRRLDVNLLRAMITGTKTVSGPSRPVK
jgi:cytochrome b